jgi:2-isopropylmalate synthase
MANDGLRGKVAIYDTTLRDGTQREGISLSVRDKLRIAQLLDQLGVAYIEAGWPASNPKDAELFERARELRFQNARLAAFGATRRSGLGAGEDAGLKALVDAGTPVVTLFGKSWPLHVTEVLRTSLDENLAMIEESVAFLRGEGREVVYDAEHFFDGWRADGDYALETLAAAARGGAQSIVLCDTNGGSLPWQIEEGMRAAGQRLGPGVTLGIHAHDDAGCGVANSLAAVRAGARQVQGTLNGYGERCGNANLCTLIPDLALKLGHDCLPEGGLAHLYELAHTVAEIANLTMDEHLPFVGRSAFAHKGGVHVAAMRRNRRSYEHVEPERVGNRSRVVVSELSGRGNILAMADELGLAVEESAAAQVVKDIKAQESNGLMFEAAEASAALLIRRRAPDYRPPFTLIDYKVIVGQRGEEASLSEATIKVAVGDEIIHTAAEGNGPVSALDAALRKALKSRFPQVERIHLVDYKVRILDGRAGTGATTRVLIDSTDGERRWSTVGASANILEASWRALADSIEYGVLP